MGALNDSMFLKLNATKLRDYAVDHGLSSDGDPLFSAVLAVFGFPPFVHRNILRQLADEALLQLGQSEVLQRHLKRQYFIHPEDLRHRLAAFAQEQKA